MTFHRAGRMLIQFMAGVVLYSIGTLFHIPLWILWCLGWPLGALIYLLLNWLDEFLNVTEADQ